MAKPYPGEWVLRSMLFVPGQIDKMLTKAPETETDCVVLDLEDAVPQAEKASARAKIRQALEAGLYKRKTAFVRINPIESGLTLRDLDGVACAHLHGFVYPMTYTADDIKKFDAQLSLIENHLNLPKGHFSIVALIETPLAVLNAYSIATASERVVALMFGCEDYMAEQTARHAEQDVSLHTPRALIAMAARSAHVVPVDTPYVRVHDLDGLRPFARHARDLGMGGMVVLSPGQIAVANEIYTPSVEEIETARAIVAAADVAEREGRGVVIVDNKFISPPTLKASRTTIARLDAIRALEEFGRR
jgi:citrate lyase subunit beta / citryl-CoA lyase